MALKFFFRLSHWQVRIAQASPDLLLVGYPGDHPGAQLDLRDHAWGNDGDPGQNYLESCEV